MTILPGPIYSGGIHKAVGQHLPLSPLPPTPYSTHLSATMSQPNGCQGMLSSPCQGLAELPSPDQGQLQDTAAPSGSSSCAACPWQYSRPHVPIRILQLTLWDQATSRATQPQQQRWQPLPHTHCWVPSSHPGFTGFVPRAQFLIGTGYLITTNQTLLQFSQMTPKKTSTAANPVAATPNPASDTLTTPLCLPCT